MNKKSEFQLIIEKYTGLLAAQLYEKKLKVFFMKDLGCLGIYRGSSSPAAADTISKIKEWERNPYLSITFDEEFFNIALEKDILEGYWSIMLHEVTHIEVGVVMNNPNTWRISHPKKFYNCMSRNKKKSEQLKKEFLLEAGK